MVTAKNSSHSARAMKHSYFFQIEVWYSKQGNTAKTDLVHIKIRQYFPQDLAEVWYIGGSHSSFVLPFLGAVLDHYFKDPLNLPTLWKVLNILLFWPVPSVAQRTPGSLHATKTSKAYSSRETPIEKGSCLPSKYV